MTKAYPGQILDEFPEKFFDAMYLTSFEELRAKIGGRNRNAKSEIAVLKTRLWIESIIRDHGVPREKLIKIACSNADPNGLIRKWEKGLHAVTESKVKRIAQEIPGSDRLYNLPLFSLLEDRPISTAELNRIMQDYFSPRFPNTLELPNGFSPTSDTAHKRVMGLGGYQGFYEIGGVFGLTALLFELRQAESKRDAELHCEISEFCYKAFPSFARSACFVERWPEFLRAVEQIQMRIPTSSMLVRPVKKILKVQIEAKEFHTERHLWPRDSKTGRFVDNKSPFDKATFKRDS